MYILYFKFADSLYNVYVVLFSKWGEPRLLHHVMQTLVAIASNLLQLKDRIRLI
jgi:hypothetical protein